MPSANFMCEVDSSCVDAASPKTQQRSGTSIHSCVSHAVGAHAHVDMSDVSKCRDDDAEGVDDDDDSFCSCDLEDVR